MKQIITSEYERETRGGMKLIILATILICFCGCAQTQAVKTVTPNIAPIVPVTPTNYLWVTWDTNYPTNANGSLLCSNCATVIIRTMDLTVPKSVWPICFVGQTNQCLIPMIWAMAFFNGYNVCDTNILTTN